MSHDNEREIINGESVPLRNLFNAAKSRSESKINLVAAVALAYHLVPWLESLPGPFSATGEITVDLDRGEGYNGEN
jgi:hypothetical protein